LVKVLIVLQVVIKMVDQLKLRVICMVVGKQSITPTGFRQRHSTIEQTQRIIQRMNEALENKQYCSATFLDISSIRQSMAYWSSVQVKKVSPSELFPYPKILFA
jgi:hypothetical protein